MMRRIFASTVLLAVATTAFAQNPPIISVSHLVSTGPDTTDLDSTILVVDIHNRPRGILDFWTSAGISAANLNGAKFIYAVDPNTGNLLTHPDQDGGELLPSEKYVTFVSKPRGQFNNPRYRRLGAASVVGGYIPNAANPTATDFDFNVAFADIPPSGLEGSGWVTRLSIDLSDVFDISGADAHNQKSYVRVVGGAPDRPGDQIICTISAAVGTSEFSNPLTTAAYNVWLNRPPAKGLRAGGRR